MDYSNYKKWFYAAAIYNLIWGTLIILFPTLFFDLTGMKYPTYIAFWQVIGMFVLVYAPAYFWAARKPDEYAHLILIGFIGKLFGPIGFVFSYLTGQLPLEFGITILTNDLIWWPSFILFLKDVIKERGLKEFLLG